MSMMLDTREPEPLELKPTQRGFPRAEFTDFNGTECSIQESSIATDYCIWLGVNKPNPMQFPGNKTGWHAYPLPENVLCTTRMHLGREQVRALLPPQMLKNSRYACSPSQPSTVRY